MCYEYLTRKVRSSRGYTKRDTVRVAPRNHTHTRPVTLTLS